MCVCIYLSLNIDIDMYVCNVLELPRITVIITLNLMIVILLTLRKGPPIKKTISFPGFVGSPRAQELQNTIGVCLISHVEIEILGHAVVHILGILIKKIITFHALVLLYNGDKLIMLQPCESHRKEMVLYYTFFFNC